MPKLLIINLGVYFVCFTYFGVNAATCGGHYTSQFGSFTSPDYPDNYPHNKECVWTVSVSPGNRVQLSFSLFQLEAEVNCNYDYVELHEGQHGGPLLGRFCGTNIPADLSAYNGLWIKFQSDYSITGRGFVASYTAAYGGNLTGSSGQIASALYPLNYPNNVDHMWTVTVATNLRVRISFTTLDMQNSLPGCSFDFLKIRDGGTIDSPLVGTYCGTTLPDVYISSTYRIRVEFHSDQSGTGKGFLFNWEATSDQPIITTVPTTTAAPDCGDVPFINDGIVSLQEIGKSTFGALADVTCDLGYNATLDTIKCLDSGEWEISTCDIIDCGDVQSISGGRISLQENGNNSFGALADVTCELGYNTTLDIIHCLHTGKWENTTCEIVVCSDVPLINGGSISLKENGNSSYGALADVTCDTGYHTTLDTIRCTATGKWENTTCVIVVCSDVPLINGGSISLKENGNSSYGALADVTCDTGYHTTLDTIRCTATGKWENTTCVIVVCGGLSSINDGTIALKENENSSYGALADVTCNKGYNATLDTITCLDTGEWENTTCDIVDCGDVPFINDGIVSLQEIGKSSFGALADVICDLGYNATLDTIKCLDSGKWEISTCDIIDCGDVQSISGGSISLQENGNNSFGALADVTCELGYNTALDIIHCLHTGKWENTTCEIVVCSDVPLINGGSISLKENGNSSYGALADVTCDKGYNTTLDTIRCTATGKWEKTTCVIVVCGGFSSIKDGTIALKENGNSSYGALADVICNKGYNATLDTITCLDTGEWENTTCDIVDCGDVPSINEGILGLQEIGKSSFGALADVTCDLGYNATLDTIKCLDSGKWEITTCNIIVCEDVPLITGGSISLQEKGNDSFGALADVTCDLGYNTTLDTIQCLDIGKWENTTCDIVVCSDVPLINGGSITLKENGNSSYGALADVTCDTGYNTTLDTIQCTDTGKWENTTCVIVVCGDVPSINNGGIVLQEDGNNSFGSLANVICDKGYNSTLDVIPCLDTGKWETTTCDIIDCGQLDDPINGDIDTSNGTTYGSAATYSCDEGFTIVGDETRVCQLNGKWSHMKPNCLLEGAKRCQDNTDSRGTVWHEVATGRYRSYDCKTNFTGIIKRLCGNDGVWKFPEYMCMRESVKNAIRQIDLLNEKATQQEVLNVLSDLKDLTEQHESIIEQDKLTDLEVSNLITSSGKIADLLSASPNLVSNEHTNDLTETISNLIDDKNNGSWKAITQTSSKVAEKVLTSVDTLSNAMAARVATSGTNLQPVVKRNLALHVKLITSDDFVFPGPDTVQVDSSDNWLSETRSQINFNPASFGGTTQKSVVSAAMFRDISDIMPDKSEDEQLNGQILSFSTLPALPGTIDPPVTMSFEQSNTQLTKATCTFWKFNESGADGVWSTHGCSTTLTSEGLTKCSCNHTTNFAVILSLQDCGGLDFLDHGVIDSSAGTKYDATVRFSCKTGYDIIGTNTSVCLFNGSWSSPNPTCSIKDCGNLDNPTNGAVSTPAGTTFDHIAVYGCNEGYSVNGAVTRLCLSNGTWSSSAPTCVEIEEGGTKCEEDVDNRGLTWPETIYGNTYDKRCDQGFTGLISRTCGPDGVWKLPKYNCVRESIEKVSKKVSTLNENATEEDVHTVLEEILKVTSFNETTDSNKTLTDGELSVLSSSLKTVADVLKSSSGVINEEITEEFLEIASNLIDDSNQNSWQSLSQSEDNDESERVLKAVDSLAEVLSSSIEDGSKNNGTFLVKKNIAIQVKSVSDKDVTFPELDKTVSAKTDENAKWFKESRSSLRLDITALTNTSVTYTTTALMFRDLSKILPTRRYNNLDDSSKDIDEIINAPILSLTISPPLSTKLNPPLRLTFAHNTGNLSNPACMYWTFPNGQIGPGFWSSEGCIVNAKNTNYTVCECDHLTNFAVLMSPFIEADAVSKALRIISIVGIGISIACLAVTLIVHMYFWKYLRNDRTTALMNLCVALLFSYILFMAGVDRTESSVACAAIAAMLQYMYLVVFCIMLVEGIKMAITVLYVFKTKSRIKVLLLFAWVIPAIIVGISLGVTQANGYGNDHFCWLSVDNGLIWAFVGPALIIITFNGICLIIVIRVMFRTKAMETKTGSEKIKTSVRSLCVLVPVMGVSWVLGIFYMNDSFYFIQYIFAILNGLEGFFIFIFHCLLNEQVKRAIQLRKRRKSSTKETSILRKISRDERKSNDLRDKAKPILDGGELAHDESSDSKYKIFKPDYPQPDVKFATPLGFYPIGRRTAAFAIKSRDKL